MVTVRLDARAAASVRQWCMVLPDPDAPEPTADGRVTLRVDFGDAEEARFLVLGLGTGAEVLDPPDLRASVAAEIAALCRRGY